MKNDTVNFLKSENEQLKKLQAIVHGTMAEEQLIVENLIHAPVESISIGQNISDKVARFGGSWRFIILFSILLSMWILINSLLPGESKFDPFPFILMNLVLSAIAALQAPIIMMSQNRREDKDRKRSENDYLINLKAELEIRSLHQKIDLMQEEQIKLLFETQEMQLKLLQKIEDKLFSIK